MKVISRVKFNDGFAFVLSDMPKLTYTKYKTCIIGTDGTFYQCYSYERPTGRWKAFAGRKFDIILSDGTVEKCYGQWWSLVNKEAAEIIGNSLISVTANSIASLKECYVYYGYMAHPEKFKNLVGGYNGITWGYHDYDALINRNKYKKLSRKAMSHYRNVILKRKSIFTK